MDYSKWVRGETGTYVTSLHTLPRQIWNTCYMPYLEDCISDQSHVFYHSDEEVKANLLESGVSLDQIKELKIDYEWDGDKYIVIGLPDGVVMYPSLEIHGRYGQMTCRPWMPEFRERMYIRSFHDADAFIYNSYTRWRENNTTAEERKTEIEDFKAHCFPLPKYRYGSNIEWPEM